MAADVHAFAGCISGSGVVNVVAAHRDMVQIVLEIDPDIDRMDMKIFQGDIGRIIRHLYPIAAIAGDLQPTNCQVRGPFDIDRILGCGCQAGRMIRGRARLHAR